MISSKLVKQYEGEFFIESEPGKGSIFTFTFKLSDSNETDEFLNENKTTGGNQVQINSRNLDFRWKPK